jgi:hypothetical protein
MQNFSIAPDTYTEFAGDSCCDRCKALDLSCAMLKGSSRTKKCFNCSGAKCVFKNACDTNAAESGSLQSVGQGAYGLLTKAMDEARRLKNPLLVSLLEDATLGVCDIALLAGGVFNSEGNVINPRKENVNNSTPVGTRHDWRKVKSIKRMWEADMFNNDHGQLGDEPVNPAKKHKMNMTKPKDDQPVCRSTPVRRSTRNKE